MPGTLIANFIFTIVKELFTDNNLLKLLPLILGNEFTTFLDDSIFIYFNPTLPRQIDFEVLPFTSV